MLQRVMIDGIELPRLYIAENQKDAELAQEKGIPYIRWTKGQDALIKMLLRPTLERMFPYIRWDSVLGKRRKFMTQVEMVEHDDPDGLDQVDLVGSLGSDPELFEGSSWNPEDSEDIVESANDVDENGVIIERSVADSEERLFYDGGVSSMVAVRKLDIEDYIGDMSSYVNLEILQRLKLMPAFIGDILECVKLNIGSGMYWREGYNKKRGLAVGRFDASKQLPNLIILDVSGSIPRGISATMIALVDTLRTQLSADLIITSSNSRFYPMGSQLPDPQTIRDKFGYGNESEDFFGILTKNIRGKHYGHVFSFGDNDTPYYEMFKTRSDRWSLEGTIVEHVHHYHTGLGSRYGIKRTGYAKWCHMLASQPKVDYDTSWCKVIRSR